MNIGIDVGGTNIKVGLVNDNGEIVLKHSVPTPKDTAENFKNALENAVEELLKKADFDVDVKAVGIGVPGIVDRENGVLVFSDKIPYGNLNARELFGKKYNAPVCVENDANCAAFGEFSVTEGQKDFVFVTLGTGVGGGIVIDGNLYTGLNGVAAEIGHITTHAGGRDCSCGRKGCLEAYASVTALIDFTKEISDQLNIDPSKITGKTAFEEAKKGNAAALKVRDRWIEEVGIGVASIVNVFQPDEVVIGGAISKEGSVLLDPIRKYVAENDYSAGDPSLPKTKINLSRIREDAGAIGAALLGKKYREQVIK